LKCPACGNDVPDDSKFCKECSYSFTGAGHTGQLNPDTVLENRYIIVKTIGRGGMGAVYMALDQRLNNRSVAIKEMSTKAVGGDLQAAIGAFKKEASMLIGLEHLSLPRILDFFPKGEDRWYLVMDYIEGQTLAEVARNRGRIPEAEVLNWASQLCEILDYLHGQQPPIIFRDLKPANIMLTSKGQIKLIDFGIARHFRVGRSADTTAYGSHGFAPPEQYGENQTSPSSDIYALGATLHYLLTGIDPGKNPFMFEPPGKTAEVSPRMESAIMKALELKAENRPKDMQEMLALLPGESSQTVTEKGGKKHKPFSNSKVPPKTTIENKKEESLIKSQSEVQTTPITIAAEIDNAANALESKTVAIDTNQNIMSTNPPTSPDGISGKTGKIRNIILAACLVLVIISGAVYGFEHHKGSKKAEMNVNMTFKGNNAPMSLTSNQVDDADTANSTTPDVGDTADNEKNTQKENQSRKIVFNDPALEKGIRDAIKKPQGDIYVDDVKYIQTLDLRAKGIKNISALSNLTNLQTLDLLDNGISDISALSKLTNLQGLYLGDNQISDISALSKLTNLQGLYLWDNQISNISALSKLTNLQYLYLNDNQISDISALSNLTNLQTLYLNDNQISDISALSNLTNLQMLWLIHNQISDYSPTQSYYQNLINKDFDL
jgi:serine/threonine protein kinase